MPGFDMWKSTMVVAAALEKGLEPHYYHKDKQLGAYAEIGKWVQIEGVDDTYRKTILMLKMEQHLKIWNAC